MSYYPIGPMLVVAGPADSSMVSLNEVEEVNINAGIQNAFATTALTAGAPVEEGVYSLPPNTTIQMQLNDADIDQLETIILGGTKVTDAGPPELNALGLGGDIKALTLPTLGCIPIWQKDDGLDAANAIWLPRAFSEDLSNILHNRMQANASSNNQYNVTWRAARAKKDPGDGVTDLDPDFQYAWFGPPGALGLDWSSAFPTL